ncbi:hypothetical protein K440DRAFT_632800 [Wilcoxina mikolae CBS 423.85]|nr:hypothetical protein K440DRAFT_632800 [Wilcoxina mikolae CBS 423.85]
MSTHTVFHQALPTARRLGREDKLNTCRRWAEKKGITQDLENALKRFSLATTDEDTIKKEFDDAVVSVHHPPISTDVLGAYCGCSEFLSGIACS